MGGNIPGGNFLGGSFPGVIFQGGVWWVGIFRVGLFPGGIFLEPFFLTNYIFWRRFLHFFFCEWIFPFITQIFLKMEACFLKIKTEQISLISSMPIFLYKKDFLQIIDHLFYYTNIIKPKWHQNKEQIESTKNAETRKISLGLCKLVLKKIMAIRLIMRKIQFLSSFTDTVMQIEKAMINDHLRVSEVSWKFGITTIYL